MIIVVFYTMWQKCLSERASPDIFVVMSYLYTRVIKTSDEVTKEYRVLCKTKKPVLKPSVVLKVNSHVGAASHILRI